VVVPPSVIALALREVPPTLGELPAALPGLEKQPDRVQGQTPLGQDERPIMTDPPDPGPRQFLCQINRLLLSEIAPTTRPQSLHPSVT
jgi:hypothetical protein